MDKVKLFEDAHSLLLQAKDAMIKVINEAVREEGGIACYDELVDEFNGYSEERYIKSNQDGNMCVFDENGYELYKIEDLSVDELHFICDKLC